MKKLLTSKKVLVAAALATIMAISGGAYAWFSYTATVSGGNITMDKLKVEASALKVYDLVDDGTPDGFAYEPSATPVYELKMMPSQSVYVGYTVTVPVGYADVNIELPGLSDFTSIDFRVDLDAMKGNGNMNPVWLDEWDATNVRNRSFADVTNPAYADWFGVSTITSMPIMDNLLDDGSIMYYYSPVDSKLYAASNVEGAGASFDVIFKITFSSQIDNRYQGAKFNFDGVDVKATQTVDEAVLDIFGINFEEGMKVVADMGEDGDYTYLGGTKPLFFLYPLGDGSGTILGMDELNAFYAAN